MRTVILLTNIFAFCTSIFGQGFYDNNNIFINKTNISRLKVTSVVATSFYSDSSFHPLSNFVFEYKFDNSGNTVYKRHWYSESLNNKFTNYKLVIDSGWVDSVTRQFVYKCIAQSNVVKFNQYKLRTKEYIYTTFSAFELPTPTPSNGYFEFSIYSNEFLIDTILFNKRVYIPQSLILFGDSIIVTNDTIITFTKTDKSLYLSSKCYQIENSYLKIDWYEENDSNVWRSYFINSLGLIDKETQNIFTTLYYYNSDNLHIRTETYQNDYRTSQTTFNYKYGSR